MTSIRTIAILPAILAGVLLLGVGCNDSDSSGDCGPATCSDGCCTAQGFCVKKGNQSRQQCGIGGTICQTCPDGVSCELGTCGGTQTSGLGGGGDGSRRCGITCNGCCQVSTVTNLPECVPYAEQSDEVCGEGNNPCQPCASGEHCSGSGECKRDDPCAEPGNPACKCNPGARQCFDPQTNRCLLGIQQNACGIDGGTCVRCEINETCVQGRCQRGNACSADCARRGCCDASGRCIVFRTSDGDSSSSSFFTGDYEQNDSQCGQGGAECRPCPADRYGRSTRCNKRGQCVTGAGAIELCVNDLVVKCRSGYESECAGWNFYVVAEYGDVSERTDSGSGKFFDTDGPPRVETVINDCVEIDVEEARGRQMTFEVREGGLGSHIFGGSLVATCRTSISTSSAYLGDSLSDRNIATTCSPSGNILRFNVYTQELR